MDEHGITYTICAPTGAAKSRITEVTGRPAHTLHKYFQFNRDDIDPIYLQTDYIFIDEGSMNDLYLFYMTVDRVYPGQRIIIIGDANQLPPVSPGEPLMQMIDAGIPTTFLKTIYRNQGGIVQAAHAILSGKLPVVEKGENFMVVKETEFGAKKRIKAAIEWLMKEKGFAFDDIQVLTPVNRGPCGRGELNEFLQSTFNLEPEIPETKFRIGDRVVHTKNNYDLNVMNGEIGKVLSPDEDDNDSPFGSTDDYALSVEFKLQDESVGYEKDDLDELQLAFASTVHKFQGQEVPAVILVMPPTAANFYLKQLPYTGITRAKKFCIVIDVGNSFSQYVLSKISTRRLDMLGYFLKQQGV